MCSTEGVIYVGSSVLHITEKKKKHSFEISYISDKVINECNFSNCWCMNTQTKELYALLYNSNIILQYQNYSVQLRGN